MLDRQFIWCLQPLNGLFKGRSDFGCTVGRGVVGNDDLVCAFRVNAFQKLLELQNVWTKFLLFAVNWYGTLKSGSDIQLQFNSQLSAL